jgi:hypothetical protein
MDIKMKNFICKLQGIITVSATDLDSLIKKMPVFTLIKSTNDPRDHFEVTA